MKGFLTGIATGLAIGYLTAPRSGKETRGQLTEAADRQTKGLKDQWEKTTAQVNSLVDDVKSQVGGAKKDTDLFANQTAKETKYAYNDMVDDASDAAKSGIDQTEDAFKF